MKIVTLVLLCATAFTAVGQNSRPDSTEPMKALNFMVGKWEGKVKYERGANEQQEAFWTAHVYYNLGGSILIIDERGSEIRSKDKTTLEILVVVHWDSTSKEYPARLYWSSKGNTGSLTGKVTVQDHTFVLQLKGSNRFTVKLNEQGQWQEVGESPNKGGEGWKKMFDMMLSRKD
jgi:hypothetical protein